MQKKEYTRISLPHIEESPCSLRDLLNILFRRQKEIILFFVVVVTMVAVVTFLLPEIYQSESKLLIQVGRESVSVDPAVLGPAMHINRMRENEINSELAILKSRLIAEKVVDKIGVGRFLSDPDEGTDREQSIQGIFSKIWGKLWRPDGANADSLVEPDLIDTLLIRNKAVKLITSNLKVEAGKKSNIIHMNFQARSPELAQESLTVLLDSYLEHHINVHKSQASPKFFQEQSESLLKELTGKEEQLRQFRTRHDISLINKQKEKLLEDISRIQNEITDTRSQVSASQAKIVSLNTALKKHSKTMEISRISGKQNFAEDKIKERFFDLRLKEAELAAKYPDDNRALIDLRKQIKLAQAALDKEQQTRYEITTGINTNYQEIQLTLDTERALLQAGMASEKALTAELTGRKEELVRLTDYETMLNRLQRDIDILKDEYIQYNDNLQRARISAALDMDKVSNVKIVQPPTLPLKHVKPRKKLNIALGILLGMFGGLVFAFVLEFLDDSLKTGEDIEKRLGLRVLATVTEAEFKTCT